MLRSLVFVSLLVPTASISLRGVGINERGNAVYRGDGGIFRCVDGVGVVDIARFNDDYCDCADGSDEPGTSACADGIFHCVNWAHREQQLHSSFVEDGVCDCCDGSDEKPGECDNTCKEVGEKARAAQLHEAEMHAQGASKRKDYAAQAVVAKGERQKRTAELRVQLEKEEEWVATLARMKASPWKAEARDYTQQARDDTGGVEQDDEARPRGSEEQRATQDGNQIRVYCANLLETKLLVARVDDTGVAELIGEVEPTKTYIAQAREGETLRFTTLHEVEGPSSMDHKVNGEGELQHIKIDAAAMKAYAVQQAETSDLNANERHALPAANANERHALPAANANERHALPAANLDETSGEQGADDEQGDDDDGSEVAEDGDSGVGAGAKGSDGAETAQEKADQEEARRLPPANDMVPDEPGTHEEEPKEKLPLRGWSFAKTCFWHPRWCIESLSGMDPDDPDGVDLARTKQLDADHREAQQKASRIRKEVTDLEEEDVIDFGPDGALIVLKGQCFSHTQQEYTYEFCPFDKFKQGHTSLGQWSEWAPDSNHSTMQYTQGATCHAGPQRTALVHLRCGVAEALIHVHEPERCAYEATFETPAVCDEHHSKRLRQSVRDQIAQLKKSNPHDEM